MKYFVKELQTNEGVMRTAGIKARDDVDEILEKDGYQAIPMCYNYTSGRERSIIHDLIKHIQVKKNWEKAFQTVKSEDLVFMQFPPINHTIFLCNEIKKLKRNNTEIIFLIHDLDMLRTCKRKDVSLKTKIRIRIEERSVLALGDAIIVHNDQMGRQLETLGFDAEKLVPLEIFDYLIPKFENKNHSHEFQMHEPIVIAGTLRRHKAQYLYRIPENIPCNLYGVGFEEENGKKSRHYFGSFDPDELPFVINGSFGLIWDGEDIDTCNGAYGEYLRINNPHKTSFYLASGIPVIIWSEAALANFVKENECGICINSIGDIPTVINNITEKQYELMKINVLKISKKMRTGYYTMKAINTCEHVLCERNGK